MNHCFISNLTNPINKNVSDINLFKIQRCKCSSTFQSTAASKVKLSTAHGCIASEIARLYCTWNVSPTLYQTDSRINNHRKQKFPPSLTLLSFKTRIKWPLSWPQPQVFRGYFFNSCNFQDNVQAFRFTGLLWWQKITWIFDHFLQDF